MKYGTELAIVVLAVLVGCSTLYYLRTRPPDTLAVFPHRITGVWEAKGVNDELLLEPQVDASETPTGQLAEENTLTGSFSENGDVDAYTCEYDGTWEADATDVTFTCKGKTTHSFFMQKDGHDFDLVDLDTGRVFTRAKALQFTYNEGATDKRLTLYEIPGQSCHACSGYLWGVFELADPAGRFNISTATPPFSAIGSYGRISTSNVIAKDETAWNTSGGVLLASIGTDHLAVIFGVGDMNQGYISSAAWLLEYSDDRLSYRGIMDLGLEDVNDEDCSAISKKIESGASNEPPCASYSGTFSIGNSSAVPGSTYNDIAVKKSGTSYDYYTDAVIPVNQEDLYTFDAGKGEYVRNTENQQSH